ncbi:MULTISPECIES: hypothetical protein [Rhizobium]|uniref:Uncharacterized protein n=1 Tax=Rhizobium esperanzae TaxID=1967781 RepID=A0A7W6XY11_9HYPH|nr:MULTISPECIES: hypothetical protein [Rhizobium]MBB4440480.1 hypothetical protein [Rhizobium esperanzae]MDH6203124.1 hypothetical protein [Rhizobium leguminosarum]
MEDSQRKSQIDRISRPRSHPFRQKPRAGVRPLLQPPQQGAPAAFISTGRQMCRKSFGIAKTRSSEFGQLEASLTSLRSQMRQKEGERGHLQDTLDEQTSLVDTLQQRVAVRNTLVGENAGVIAGVIDATETLKRQRTQLAIQKG